MNRDFSDMLSALYEAGAEFLVVGAHALAAHGFPRATGDLDIWVRPTPENATHVWEALHAFGAPLFDLCLGDLSTVGVVFQLGTPPSRIDLMTSISGVDFDRAWAGRLEIRIENLTIGCLGRGELIVNKRATGRAKDLLDVELLESSDG